MALELSPVLLSDLPAVHHLSLTTDQDSPISKVLFPNGASEATIAHLVNQDEKSMQDPKSTARHVMVREVHTGNGQESGVGKVVSYAMWNFFIGREKEGKESGDDEYYDEWPSEVNRNAVATLFARGENKREEIMAGRQYACLTTLCTAHSHRRKGAASLIISWGLALADVHNLPTYVESTPAALPLYLKHGFDKVSTLAIDLRPWSSPRVLEHIILVRPAKLPSSPSPPPSAPSSNQIALSPLITNADFIPLAPIEDAAYAAESATSNPNAQPAMQIFPLIMKNVPPSRASTSRSQTLLHNALTDRTVQYIKAFHPPTNTIIGWAKWNFLLHPSDHVLEDPWPDGANLALVDAFFGRIEREREASMAGKRYAFMHVVVVSPEWQGKGVGRRLLEWGLERADKEGLETWIDASPAGLGLYKKLGWREVGEVAIDLTEWGGEGRDVCVQLVRKVGGAVES